MKSIFKKKINNSTGIKMYHVTIKVRIRIKIKFYKTREMFNNANACYGHNSSFLNNNNSHTVGLYDHEHK